MSGVRSRQLHRSVVADPLSLRFGRIDRACPLPQFYDAADNLHTITTTFDVAVVSDSADPSQTE